MLTHFKTLAADIFRTALLVLGLFLTLQGIGQSYPVTITTIVSPPFSTQFSYYVDHPGALTVTLLNTSQQPLDIYLAGSFTSDNGISISSEPGYKPAMPVTLEPQIPFQLTVDNIGDIFSGNHLVYQGITEDELMRMSGLPEGNYQVCFQAFDYDTDQPLSGEEPSGCSNTIIITYVDPPEILSPMCGDTIRSLSLSQNVLISWTIPVGAVNSTYHLKMVEMHPGDRNPNDVMASASPPYFYETEVTSNQILLGAAEPQFVAGRSYAFTIQAIDPDGQIIYKNNGVSEACWFTYVLQTTPFSAAPPDLHAPQKGEEITTKTPVFNWSYNPVEGENAQYRLVVVPTFFNQSFSDAIKNNNPVYSTTYNSVPRFFLPSPSIGFEDGKKYAWQVQVIDNEKNEILRASDIWYFTYKSGGGWHFFSTSQASGRLLYEFADPGEYTGKPLANANIKLMVKYVMNYSSHDNNTNSGDQSSSGTVVLPEEWAIQRGFKDVNKVLSTTVTDANGYFTFSFFSTDSSNVVVKKNALYQRVNNNAGEFHDNYYGDVYRQFRIVLDEPYQPYYLNPDEDIIVQPDQTVQAGNIFTYVRSYKLTVTVKPDWEGQQFTHAPIPNMIVYLLRKTRPVLVPADEGKPRPPQKMTIKGMEVIGIDTSDVNGRVTFKRLVRNVGFSDRYYLWAESDPVAGKENYRVLNPDMFRFEFDSPEEYSSRYSYPEFNHDLTAKPRQPEVAGKIVRGDVGQPLSGVHVNLMNFPLKEEAHWYTYATGDFKFTHLPVEVNSDWKVDGPVRYLYIYKKGYVSRNITIEGRGLNLALLPGEKWHDYNIALEPATTVNGEVADENGNGVMAKVTLVGGSTVDTKRGKFSFKTFTFGPSSFSIPSPTGHQTLIVDPTPYAADYFIDTVEINVAGSPFDAGLITLHKKSHKLRVIAFEVPPGDGMIVPGTEKRLPNAIVQLKSENGNLIKEKQANESGVAAFDFKNASNRFLITVKSPSENKDLETQTVSVFVPESKTWTEQKVFLRKAASVEGYVYVGTENKPVEGAHVYLDNSSSDGEKTEAFTDDKGHFVIHNVPVRNYQTFSAAKSMSNTIGDHITLNVTEEGVKDVKFHLKVYSDMDITKLLGFPIEVTSLSETPQGVKITGKLVKLDSLKNDLFSTPDHDVGFAGVIIVPGKNKSVIFGKEVPVAVPQKIPMQTGVNSMALQVFDQFTAVLHDSVNGIVLEKTPGEKGVLAGKVFVGAGNFSIPHGNLSFPENGFYLKKPGGDQLKTGILTANRKKPFDVGKTGIPVAGKNNGDVAYKLFNYDATAQEGKSFLTNKGLKWKTILHTQLKNVTPADLAMDIGDVNIRKDKIEPVSGSDTPLQLQLDKWKIEGTQWVLNGYLTIQKGVLHTNVVDVPITEMMIKPTALSQGKFNLTNMALAGVVPLHILGKPVLNYDKANKYWFLFVGKGENEYSSYLSGLPGMKDGDKITINNFSLNSKGGKDFSPVYGQQPSTIYNVGFLSANGIESFRDYVEISGLTFDIPGFSQITSVRYLKDENGKLKFKLVPFGMSLKAKGVQMDFGFNEEEAATQKLDDFGFVSKGRTYEKGKFSLVTWLYHTRDSTSIWVETSPWQQLPIGGQNTYFAKVTGSMHVANNEWTNFGFAGDMTGTKGVTDDRKRMAFVVKGEIEADGQEIGIKNVNTPFGDLSWTYEFENSRLIGTLNFNQDMDGTNIKGQAQTLVDPDGWYFIAGGEAKIPGLGPAHAALLFGDYPRMTRDVKNIFAACSYKKDLPDSFEDHISGFLVSGAVAVPIIVPNIDIDLIIFVARFGLNAGGDVRLWMNFDDSGSEYGIGMLNFLHAYATSSGMTPCTSLNSDARVEMGFTGTYKRPSGIFSLDGCGGFNLGIGVIQKTPTEWGCSSPVLFSHDFNIAFKEMLHIDSDGNKSMNFDTGTCSGQ